MGADVDVVMNGYLEILKRNLGFVLNVKALTGIDLCEKQELRMGMLFLNNGFYF